MAKRKYSEVEMIGALKQLEAGRTAAEVGAGTLGAGCESENTGNDSTGLKYCQGRYSTVRE